MVALFSALAATGVVIWQWQKQSTPVDRQIRLVADEVGNAFETFFSLSAVNDGVLVGFGDAHGNTLLHYSLPGASFKLIPLPGSLSRLFTSSPDRRSVPLSISEPSSAADRSYHPQHSFHVYDLTTSQLRPVAGVGDPGKYPAWLDKDTLLCQGVAPGKAVAGIHLCQLQDGQKWVWQGEVPSGTEAESFPAAVTQVSRHGDHSVCYFREGEIRVFELGSRKEEAISAFKGGFLEASWLTYRPEGKEFMFCGRRANQPFRFLYVYTPASNALRQVSFEHTYNGQWVQGGEGAAYVQNRSNLFSLRTTNAHSGSSWHFFPGGHVERYAAAADGRGLFAVASTNAEPRGLWYCDLTTGEQRLLKPGNRKPFTFCEVSTPLEHGIPAAEGRLIPAYLFPPTHPGWASNAPVVIYIPPRTAQCSRGYELQAQIMANLGFFYLGINYRGCDGYGTGYAIQWSPENAASDVLDAIRWVRSDPRFGSSKIFLAAMSESALVMAKVMEAFPQEIQGAVVHSPVPFSLGMPQPGVRSPPLLITMGKTDPLAKSARTTRSQLQAQGYSIEYREIANFAHPGASDVGARLEQERAAAEFIVHAEQAD